jgi:hypothetical protein
METHSLELLIKVEVIRLFMILLIIYAAIQLTLLQITKMKDSACLSL